MRCIPAVLPASPTAARADIAAHALAVRPARSGRRHARQPGPVRGMAWGLAVAILLASATGAGAQVPRNGPEWGGKDHQPTEGATLGAERRAGVEAPKAEQNQDSRTVDQIDRQLLREEGLSTSSVPPAPR